MWQLQRPMIEKHFATRGLKVLYAVPWPPQGLFANKPIRELGRLRRHQDAHVQPDDGAHRRVHEGHARRRGDGRGEQGAGRGPHGHHDHVCCHGSGEPGVGSDQVLLRDQRLVPQEHRFRERQGLQFTRAAGAGGRAEGGVLGGNPGLGPQPGRDGGLHQRVAGARHQGGRVSGDFDKEIKRLGEKFAREWVRSVGNEANNIFIPYYTQ